MANQNKNFNSNKKKKKNPYSIYWIYALIGLGIIGVQLFWNASPSSTLNHKQTFFKLMAKGQVNNIILWRNVGRVDFKINEAGEKAIKNGDYKGNDFNIIKRALNGSGNSTFGGTASPTFSFKIADSKSFIDQFEQVNDKRKASGYDAISYRVDEEHNYFGDIFSILLPIIILVGLWFFVMRRMTGGGGKGPGGQIFNIGKSKARVFEKGKSTNVSFKDVAGLEEAKEEVQEIVSFLKNPKKYTALGAKIPKGALLVGEPGVGKTLLAKAVAGEADVPFFSLSGSDFVEMFVGVGASRVRDLFKQAKEKSPAIIFIDEIDAIGGQRGKRNSMGTNDERENTLNQLLTEMDGFDTNSGVIILAASNRQDVLDKALMRAGRFDRQIHIDLPDLNERKAIFEVHLKPLRLKKDMDIDFLAKQTPGFSGADIANLCNEAALIAARRDKKAVEKQDFLDAVDRIIGGLEKRNKIITPEEKKKIAFHEAGHASVSWLTKYAHPLVKVTIVPRGRSLGAAWYLPEERMMTTKAHILDEMCAAMGGRAAEELMFGEISTGALSDLEKVYKQAQAMVVMYGLSEEIGNVSYYDSRGQSQFQKPYSEHTGQKIDKEVSRIIEGQYERAKKILSENKDKLTKLANLLLEKEVIFKADLVDIFGEREWSKLTPGEKLKEEEKRKEDETLTRDADTNIASENSSPDAKNINEADAPSENEGEKDNKSNSNDGISS